ncbi:flagellar protein D/E [Halobacteria archaeon AArc-m2/3/4]|uniref:Flagellar protein D/E n=1 Tax=Natronoglomus mannanivorans TaxID=2979990 RepID=A0AAP2Z4D5_9EURY|nr:flagellar protein D/E [Halobacteria archaeon AArc-xg1-1]MCU4974290.1 flagellar protein D/E [Halobacteria archaeon AArc-m2/3/4]
MSAEKPYLETLEQSAGRTDATIQWARFLGETFGTTGALNCLRYYEDLEWISPLVRRQMVSYLRGLSIGEIHNKRYDEPTTLEYPLESLSGTLFGAHAQSLEYIATIRDDDLEEHVMIARMAERRVDRQIADEEESEQSSEMVSIIRDSASQVH